MMHERKKKKIKERLRNKKHESKKNITRKETKENK
jgi:hypothetical protein